MKIGDDNCNDGKAAKRDANPCTSNFLKRLCKNPNKAKKIQSDELLKNKKEGNIYFLNGKEIFIAALDISQNHISIFDFFKKLF